MIRFFDPGKMYKNIKSEIDSEIQGVLSRGDLILRKDVEDFEKSLASFVGTKYAVGLNSCTDALILSLRVLGIGRGDTVLVPSRTFVATPQAVIQSGATPVFYDIEGGLPITKKTKAIIPVHIEGAFDSRFDEILSLKIPIVEDAAQAMGAEKAGKRAGSFGVTGCFSFYPSKLLSAYGDGGAITTDNEEIYDEIKSLRNHDKDFGFTRWGYNSRLDNLQAAVLNVKIKYLSETLSRRAEIASLYHEKLFGLPLEFPRHEEGRVWQDYIIRTKDRDSLYTHLKERGIETMKNNYPFPVPKLPLAQKYEDETLRLPCNEGLEIKEVLEIIHAIKIFYE